MKKNKSIIILSILFIVLLCFGLAEMFKKEYNTPKLVQM
jgi:hypothetical protein